MKYTILSAILFCTFFSAQSQYKNFIDQPYLEITGNADTLVTPNEIYIRIFISEKDTKDKVSIEDMERNIVKKLKYLGLDTEKVLTTNDMSSNFKSYFLKSKDVMKTKQYILKVKDAVTATKVFIGLEEIGISNTSIDRVDHSDLENIKNTMRSRAIENAKTRAESLTKPLNQQVGPAIHISDQENFYANRMMDRQEVMIAYSVNQKVQEELPNIEFEKIRVVSNINAKFILK
jgi:uncharacterized protein